MTDDPFTVLGLDRAASADDVRSARRDLAREHHPDAGGDADSMREINVAAADALKIIAAPSNEQQPTSDWVGTTRDVPSFTVEALPVETFEALLLAAAELGEIDDDDPPYVLRTRLDAPIACWCQLDVVPDADASTVSVTIAPLEGRSLPLLVDVRNSWITAINSLDWDRI